MTSLYSPIDEINSNTSRPVNASIKQYLSVSSVNLCHFYSIVGRVCPKDVLINPVYGYSFHHTNTFRHIFFFVRLKIHSFDSASHKVTPIDIVVFHIHCNGRNPSNVLHYHSRSGWPSRQLDTIYGISNAKVQARPFPCCEEKRKAN